MDKGQKYKTYNGQICELPHVMSRRYPPVRRKHYIPYFEYNLKSIIGNFMCHHTQDTG